MSVVILVVCIRYSYIDSIILAEGAIRWTSIIVYIIDNSMIPITIMPPVRLTEVS
ncbi:hypothetical protein LPE01_09430 [Lactiplantibacillus pentosus]|nr:hypothetical protein LPE01_09430 [Lactiplantibacillus pentosus]